MIQVDNIENLNKCFICNQDFYHNNSYQVLCNDYEYNPYHRVYKQNNGKLYYYFYKRGNLIYEISHSPKYNDNSEFLYNIIYILSDFNFNLKSKTIVKLNIKDYILFQNVDEIEKFISDYKVFK